MKRNKGYFSISAVAQMFSIHPQTVRMYETEGLICPKRTEGNTRLFSEDDINKLEEIIYLTHHLGINLAGVQMVLKLKKQIKKMQKEMNQLFDQAKKDLAHDEDTAKHLVKASATQLVRMKQQIAREKKKQGIQPTTADTQADSINLNEWNIEYDDK